MRIYTLIQISSGEELVSLDGIKYFTNKKDAVKALRAAYKDTKEMFRGGYTVDEKFCNDWEFKVSIEDDESLSGYSVYRGYIETAEVA